MRHESTQSRWFGCQGNIDHIPLENFNTNYEAVSYILTWVKDLNIVKDFYLAIKGLI